MQRNVRTRDDQNEEKDACRRIMRVISHVVFLERAALFNPLIALTILGSFISSNMLNEIYKKRKLQTSALMRKTCHFSIKRALC